MADNCKQSNKFQRGEKVRISKEIKERIEKGFDVLIEKNGKEYFFFKEEDSDYWTQDIIVDGEIEETNFIPDDEILDEIKSIK